MSLSDELPESVSPGVLNPNVKPNKFRKNYDFQNGGTLKNLKEMILSTLDTDSVAGTGPWRGIVLMELPDITGDESAPIPVNSWLNNYFANKGDGSNKQTLPYSLKRYKIMIPELHAHLPQPTKWFPYDTTIRDPEIVKVGLYPTFIAKSADLESAKAGDVVWADYGNRKTFEEPIYLGKIFSPPTPPSHGASASSTFCNSSGTAQINSATGNGMNKNNLPSLLSNAGVYKAIFSAGLEESRWARSNHINAFKKGMGEFQILSFGHMEYDKLIKAAREIPNIPIVIFSKSAEHFTRLARDGVDRRRIISTERYWSEETDNKALSEVQSLLEGGGLYITGNSLGTGKFTRLQELVNRFPEQIYFRARGESYGFRQEINPYRNHIAACTLAGDIISSVVKSLPNYKPPTPTEAAPTVPSDSESAGQVAVGIIPAQPCDNNGVTSISSYNGNLALTKPKAKIITIPNDSYRNGSRPRNSTMNFREDAGRAMQNVKNIVNQLGGLVILGQSNRSLSSYPSGGNGNVSQTSMHYTYLAFDLDMSSGTLGDGSDRGSASTEAKATQNCEYIITLNKDNSIKNKRGIKVTFIIWARSDKPAGTEVSGHKVQSLSLEALRCDKGSGGGPSGSLVTGNFINLTAILMSYGFQPISPIQDYLKNCRGGDASEWWHFQFEDGINIGDTWAQTLTKVHSEEELQRAPTWKHRNRTWRPSFLGPQQDV